MCVEQDDAGAGTTDSATDAGAGTTGVDGDEDDATTTGHQGRTDDGGTDPTHDASDDSTGEPPPAPVNLVFVTSSAQAPGTLGGLSAADELCNTLAADAALPGTYVAWLSTEEVDARDRLGNARGWIRVDGLPFVDTLEDLVAGEIFYPIRIDETGADAGSVLAATATMADGTYDAGRDCAGWTSTDGSTRGSRVDTSTWTTNHSFSCASSSAHIYCFGIDHEAPVSIEPTSERYAFLASPIVGSAGLEAFDDHCGTVAQAAGLPGEYKAFVATPEQSASARFELSGEPWSLPNGVLITADPADLSSGDLLSPIWRGASGATATGNVWTGANSPSVPASDACGNWDDAEGTGHSGVTSRSINFMETTFTTDCSIARRLFCLRD